MARRASRVKTGSDYAIANNTHILEPSNASEHGETGLTLVESQFLETSS